MVARSQPIAVKLKPDPPQDEKDITARLLKLRREMNRHLAEATRKNAEIIKLEQLRQDAA